MNVIYYFFDIFLKKRWILFFVLDRVGQVLKVYIEKSIDEVPKSVQIQLERCENKSWNTYHMLLC